MRFRTLNIALIALIALVSVAVSLPATATDFAVDAAHSSVSFKVRHMVISKTRGSFTAFEGMIHLDEKDITKSSVEISIDVSSVDTANDDRDEHLRGEDFFDVEKHPKMTFKSSKIVKQGSGHVAHGELTIKGVTNKVALPFEVTGQITDPWGNQRIGVSVGSITIDRQAYGLTWSKTMEAGGLMVGNEVTIDIEVEAVKVKEEAKPEAKTRSASETS